MAPLSSAPSVTLAEIHRLVGGTVHGDVHTQVSALTSLGKAHPDALSFVANDKALRNMDRIRAGALLTHRHLPELSIPQIVVSNPQLACALVADRWFVHRPAPRGIAEDLAQGIDVRIGPDPSIWPSVTLGDRVSIGARVTLYPGVFIGSDSTVGDDTVLHPNVVVREGCTIGARVVAHSGTVIGADGFGYVQDRGRNVKIPQLGGVLIEDDVELGANVTIDRATYHPDQTVIRQGTKVDNLVQIAHNVTIGEHSIVVAQVGIAGSTLIGHHVMIGGQAGLADHLVIGDQVMIAARAGVNRSLESNQIVSGAPVMPHEVWVRAQAVIPRLPELRQAVRTLEERQKQLDASRRTSLPSKTKAKKRKRKG
jgi:UDP-3-O-[3-hydroxymyristoyl] glucosamine N-acyltransferase